MDHKKSVILTCLVAVLWSLAGLNIKVIHWSSYAIAAGRCCIAFILLTPYVLKMKKLKIDKYVAGGAICFAGFNYCFITSTKLTTSAIAIMMQYTAPVYVVLLSWFFLRERISKTDILATIFVCFGMVLFFMDSEGGGTVLGNIIAVFNGVTFAGLSIFLRLQKNGNPFLSMYLGNILSALLGIPFILQAGLLDMYSFLFLVIAGCLVALTYTIYAKASTGLSAFETVLLPIIDPVMNPIWVFLFLGERPGILSITGAFIILVAVTVKILLGLRNLNMAHCIMNLHRQ